MPKINACRGFPSVIRRRLHLGNLKLETKVFMARKGEHKKKAAASVSIEGPKKNLQVWNVRGLCLLSAPEPFHF